MSVAKLCILLFAAIAATSFVSSLLDGQVQMRCAVVDNEGSCCPE